jgi:uncharacterized repeat protein (TIGR03803 family)
MQPNGSSYTESVLYSFQGGTDGDDPHGGLIADKQGALYGTTQFGGSAGAGTAFKLTPSGSGYTESILYSFHGTPDGSQPLAGLYLGPDGALYGTTSLGGSKNNGTVFKLALSGRSFTDAVLWNFGSVSGDGAFPWGGVIVDENGVIYGTTIDGGLSGSSAPGTFFTLTSSARGPKEKLFYFNGDNGGDPEAAPTADRGGNVYIPAYALGSHLFGAVAEAPKNAGRFSYRGDRATVGSLH